MSRSEIARMVSLKQNLTKNQNHTQNPNLNSSNARAGPGRSRNRSMQYSGYGQNKGTTVESAGGIRRDRIVERNGKVPQKNGRNIKRSSVIDVSSPVSQSFRNQLGYKKRFKSLPQSPVSGKRFKNTSTARNKYSIKLSDFKDKNKKCDSTINKKKISLIPRKPTGFKPLYKNQPSTTFEAKMALIKFATDKVISSNRLFLTKKNKEPHILKHEKDKPAKGCPGCKYIDYNKDVKFKDGFTYLNQSFEILLSYQDKPRKDVLKTIQSKNKPDFSDVEFWIRKGYELSKEGKIEAAIDYYLQGSILESNNLEVSYNLGCLYNSCNKLKCSIIWLAKAHSIDPYDPKPILGLAVTMVKLQ
ncbi:unnamed protein product [Moneuplotes crassus]|uniref:Uncharacterized protein n=1 Tax=Euplotes crassus TaxID=5936 RepID=A0AAD1UC40_EUPCR|nr:unnamed protein product [Moneuplotes crassus]